MTTTAAFGQHRQPGCLRPQEQRVVARLLRGENPKTIALALGIKRRTVYWYVDSARKRLGISGGQVVAYCYQHRDCCGWEFSQMGGRGDERA